MRQQFWLSYTRGWFSPKYIPCSWAWGQYRLGMEPNAPFLLCIWDAKEHCLLSLATHALSCIKYYSATFRLDKRCCYCSQGAKIMKASAIVSATCVKMTPQRAHLLFWALTSSLLFSQAWPFSFQIWPIPSSPPITDTIWLNWPRK